MEGAVWPVVLVQGDNILHITADWKMAKNGTCQNGNQPRLDLYYLGHSMPPAFSFIPQVAALGPAGASSRKCVSHPAVNQIDHLGLPHKGAWIK